MSFGSPKYWVHKDEYYGALESDKTPQDRKDLLRALTLAGTIGIVTICNDETRSGLTKVKKIIAKRGLELVEQAREDVA